MASSSPISAMSRAISAASTSATSPMSSSSTCTCRRTPPRRPWWATRPPRSGVSPRPSRNVSVSAVTPTALGKSIEIYNALRARLRALYALRIAEPQKLSTSELYAVLRAVSMAPPEEAMVWLDTLLAELPRRDARPRDRPARGHRGRLLRAAAARPPRGARGGGVLRGRGRPDARLALVHLGRGERRRPVRASGMRPT